jgi:hypothetical protein
MILARLLLVGGLTFAQYIDTLDGLDSAARANGEGASTRLGAIAHDLPPVWQVETSRGIFEISTRPLALDVRALAASHDEALRDHLLSQLRLLRSEARAFNQPSEDVTDKRASIDEILSTREFEGVHGPSWMDRLRQRALELVARLLDRISPSTIPAVNRILVYGLMAGALIAVAWWLRDLLPRKRAVAKPSLEASQQLAKDWTAWHADAQAAAAADQWSEAVRCCYWCAVSFLETKGAWRRDQSRTPREYLRLLSPGTEDGRALAALTKLLERVWYGTDAANARTFTDAMDNLKQLGCVT